MIIKAKVHAHETNVTVVTTTHTSALFLQMIYLTLKAASQVVLVIDGVALLNRHNKDKEGVKAVIFGVLFKKIVSKPYLRLLFWFQLTNLAQDCLQLSVTVSHQYDLHFCTFVGLRLGEVESK